MSAQSGASQPLFDLSAIQSFLDSNSLDHMAHPSSQSNQPVFVAGQDDDTAGMSFSELLSHYLAPEVAKLPPSSAIPSPGSGTAALPSFEEPFAFSPASGSTSSFDPSTFMPTIPGSPIGAFSPLSEEGGAHSQSAPSPLSFADLEEILANSNRTNAPSESEQTMADAFSIDPSIFNPPPSTAGGTFSSPESVSGLSLPALDPSLPSASTDFAAAALPLLPPLPTTDDLPVLPPATIATGRPKRNVASTMIEEEEEEEHGSEDDDDEDMSDGSVATTTSTRRGSARSTAKKPVAKKARSSSGSASANKKLPKTSVQPLASGTLHKTSARSSLPPVPQWADKPDDAEYAKLSSKEKRQLRNKISARNFRHRRKEYITTLEEEISSRDTIITELRDEVGVLRTENSTLRSEVSMLKDKWQELLDKMSSLAGSTPTPVGLGVNPARAVASAGGSASPVTIKEEEPWALDSPKLAAPQLPNTSANAVASTSSGRRIGTRSTNGIQVPNLSKDVAPNTLGRRSTGSWTTAGFGGPGGGYMPVHTTLVPDLTLAASLNAKSSLSAFAQPQNFNPALNNLSPQQVVELPSLTSHLRSNPSTNSSTNAPKSGGNSPIDDLFSTNPFFLRPDLLELQRAGLYGRLAHNAAGLAAAKKQAGPEGEKLAQLPMPNGFRPAFFASPSLSSGKPGKDLPPTPSSTASELLAFQSPSSASHQDAESLRTSAYVASLATQTLLSRMTSAFVDAFAGKPEGMDGEKVAAVLGGRARLQVVPVDSPSSVAAPRDVDSLGLQLSGLSLSAGTSVGSGSAPSSRPGTPLGRSCSFDELATPPMSAPPSPSTFNGSSVPPLRSPFADEDDTASSGGDYHAQLGSVLDQPSEEEDEFGEFVYSGKDADELVNEEAIKADEEDDEDKAFSYRGRLEEVLGSARSDTTEGLKERPETGTAGKKEGTGMNGLGRPEGERDSSTPVPPLSRAASRVTSAASYDEFPSLPSKRPLTSRSSFGGSPAPASPASAHYPRRPSYHPQISRLRSISTQSFPTPNGAPSNRFVSSSSYNTAFEFPAGSHSRPPFNSPPSTSGFDNISRRSSTSNLFELPSASELPTASASNASSTAAAPPPTRTIKWSSLKRISSRLYLPAGQGGVSHAEAMAKSAMGTPTVMAVSGVVAVGTSKGWVMVFDFGQNLRCVCGTEGIAKEAGAVTALAISQDHTFLAVGHANGSIHLYSLLKPSLPARSVPPTTLPQVLTGRKEGHLVGSKILHLGFVGARHTAIVSSDETGLAFYHSLGKVLMLASTDIIRMLGRYPDPATRPALTSTATAPPSATISSPLGTSFPSISSPASPIARSASPTLTPSLRGPSSSKKPTTILDMAPLPLGPAPHPPSDALSLVALLTPSKLVIVGLKPAPRTWWRVGFPKEGDGDGRGFATAGVLGWWPSVRRVEPDQEAPGAGAGEKEKREQEEPGEDPMLAWAWGRRVRLVRVRGARRASGAVSAKVAAAGGVEFEEMVGWSCDGTVLGLRWYSERVIIVLTPTHIDVFDVSTRQRIGRDVHDIRSVVSQDSFASAFDSSVPPEETAMYSASFTTYKRKLFMLGFSNIQAGAILSWTDRILALMQPDTILEAIETTTAYLEGQVDASTIALPDDPVARRDVVEPKLREILNASLDFVFSEDRLRDGSHSDAASMQRLFEGLVGTCVRACQALEEVDWLFDELYERYEQNGIEGIFLDRIEPFVLAGAVHALPPSVSQRLIAIHEERRQFDAAQRIIWSIDPQNLDLNQALTLCQKHKLYDALIHIYTRAIHDYVAPLVELVALVRRILQHRRQRPRRIGGGADDVVSSEDLGASFGSRKGEQDVEATVPEAYKVFAYLSQALIGQSYPNRDELPFEEAVAARKAIYSFLLSGRTLTWPEKGGKSVLTAEDEGGAEPTYPYLRLLLRFDAEAMLDTLDLAFEDSYLDDSNPDRQRIVDLLLEVMSPSAPSASDDFSLVDRTFLHIFVARNLPKYPQYINLPPSTLHEILVGLASDPDQSMIEDRQLAAEYLLSTYTPQDVDATIELFEQAGFFRILRSIYRGERRWASLASTYLRDPDVGADIFGFLRETLKLASRSTQAQREQLAETILEAVPSLIQADEAGLQRTAELVDTFLPSHHSDVVSRLASTPWRQFAYLRCLLEPAHADFPDSPAAQTADRSPSTRLDTPQRLHYLSLLCKHEPQHVVRYLESDTSIAKEEEVLRVCEEAEAFDALVWSLDRRGETKAALDKADEMLETRTDLLLQRLLQGDAEDDEADEGEMLKGRSAVALLEQISALSAAATSVCVQRTTGRRRPKDLSPEDLWFRLLSSLVATVRSIRALAPSPTRPSDRSASHRRISGASIIVRDDNDESQLLSPRASELISSLIPTALSSLVSTTSSRDVSFPRLMRRLIDSNSRSPAANRSYSEFKAIVGSMLDTYAFEGDLLSLSSKISSQDLFAFVEAYKVERDRGWRPGDGGAGECAECLQPIWGPQGQGSSPPISRSASVSMVVETLGMTGRPRMKKRPSLKGKEVDWPEYHPSTNTFGGGPPALDPPRGVVVGRDGRLWHQSCHLLRHE
ncbi:hypothetical protein JCM5296_002675 [Sporobolomyces johnsonii]